MTVGIQRSEMRLCLDCHVATSLLLAMTAEYLKIYFLRGIKNALNKFLFNRLRAKHAITKQALARNCGLWLCSSYFESKEGLRG